MQSASFCGCMVPLFFCGCIVPFFLGVFGGFPFFYYCAVRRIFCNMVLLKSSKNALSHHDSVILLGIILSIGSLKINISKRKWRTKTRCVLLKCAFIFVKKVSKNPLRGINTKLEYKNASLALVVQPFSDGVTIKTPHGIDMQLH